MEIIVLHMRRQAEKKTVLLNSRKSFCVISVLIKMLTFTFNINKTSF